MKPLSELLEAVEPEFIDYDENCTSVCDRESYEKMKAVAIELAKALEITEVRSMDYKKMNGSAYMIAKESLTRARSLLEGEK